MKKPHSISKVKTEDKPLPFILEDTIYEGLANAQHNFPNAAKTGKTNTESIQTDEQTNKQTSEL
jgi:hypothetical protein